MTDQGDAVGPDEEELLAAFDRLRPQGSVRWAFDDAVRRVDQPDLDSSAGALPWPGLPDDLWERGRSARIGQRFVGDVARALADILAADARAVADAAVAAVNGDRFVATWEALQYLSARVEALEDRVDPLGLEAAELPTPQPDQDAFVDTVGSWFADVDPSMPVVVGESGNGALLEGLRRTGRPAVGIDPRGAAVWQSLGAGTAGAEGPPEMVLDHVDRHLASMPDRSVAGVVLLGCVDRADRTGKLDLVEQAIRITVSGGSVAVLPVDQEAWDAALTNPARDLAAGRPFHPETWILLLQRLGGSEPAWHRSGTGRVHAVVAGVDR